jgi:hypothetical protein
MILCEKATSGALVVGVMSGKSLSNYKSDFKMGVLQAWANTLNNSNFTIIFILK